MSSSAKVWFRSLFRPKVKSMIVEIVENGSYIQDVSRYPQHKLIALIKGINALCSADTRNSSYWFETELYEHHNACWNRGGPKLTMHVSCYRESTASNDMKTLFPIPPRICHKLLGKRFQIYLEQTGYTHLPAFIEVKFSLVK